MAGTATTTGHIQGLVSEETRTVSFWGGRALLAVGVVTLAVGLLTGGTSFAERAYSLVPPLVLVVVLVVICFAMVGKGQSAAKGVAQLGGKAFAGAVGIAKVGASGARGSASLLVRTGASTFQITVRRFRVVDSRGLVTSCMSTGEIRGDVMRQGDLVVVEGRKSRDGVVRARVVRILDRVDGPPRATIHSHLPFGFQVARSADLLAKAVAALLVIRMVLLITSGR